MIQEILKAFGLPEYAEVNRIGTGHIHQTYRVHAGSNFILQRINNAVFKQPEIIACNLRVASDYLKKNYPDYLFLTPLRSTDNKEMVYDAEGFPWRLFPYRENTYTVDKLETTGEAFSAAREFAQLTAYLNKIDVAKFQETIPRFHDLSLRYKQFEEALSHATDERKQLAATCIDNAMHWKPLMIQYETLVKSGALKLRITHNDTKINNVLFDRTSREAVCVIDLDTLMPGYFIYDLGDMVRTFVCPVSEEEKNYELITFRKEMYEALLAGYMSSMEEVMLPSEKTAIPFAGKMMTYIMALRFLADFLNGDIYYYTTYPGQNLVRAGNQFRLLEVLGENII